MAAAGVMKMWPCGACSGLGYLGLTRSQTSACPRCNGTGDALRYRDGPLHAKRAERIERIEFGLDERLGPKEGDGL